MTIDFSWDLLAIFLTGLLSCLGLTGLFRVIALRFGIVDHPDGIRKTHKAPIPLMGGVALLLSFALTSWIAGFTQLSWFSQSDRVAGLFPIIPILAAYFGTVGLWDDVYELRPRYKFSLQIVGAVLFAVFGNRVELMSLFGFEFDLNYLGVPFTIFWIVACVNTVNLIDGLDGLAGTIGVIVCLTLAAVSAMVGQTAVAAVALILAGCLSGFLWHNWPPARIYLGDSGSMSIGFLIAVLSIEASVKTATGFALLIAVVLMGVPLFDTTMAIVRRKLSGQPIGAADRNHIHHRLQDHGLSRQRCLLFIAGLSILMSMAAVISTYMANDFLAVAACLTIVGMLISARLFGYDETLLLIQHIQAVRQLLPDTSQAIRTGMVIARFQEESTRRPSEIWQEIQNHMNEIGGQHLRLEFLAPLDDALISEVSWRSEQPDANKEIDWSMECSVVQPSGIRATIKAVGNSDRQRGKRFDDLYHIFDAFCRYCPSDWGDDIREESPQTIKASANTSAPDDSGKNAPFDHNIGERRAA